MSEVKNIALADADRRFLGEAAATIQELGRELELLKRMIGQAERSRQVYCEALVERAGGDLSQNWRVSPDGKLLVLVEDGTAPQMIPPSNAARLKQPAGKE